MAGSLNRVQIIGHLGKDPEIRHTSSGAAIANLSVATTESWKDKSSGEKKEATEWHRVVIFNENLAKIAEQYLRKGSKVFIEGKLQTRKWTDKDGVDRYSTEIVLASFNGQIIMLGGKQDGGDNRGESRQSAPAQRQAPSQPAAFNRDEMDDEIPF